MFNVRERSFALPVFAAAVVLFGSTTASAAACPNPPIDLGMEGWGRTARMRCPAAPGPTGRS
jgi:hypothetical protein